MKKLIFLSLAVAAQFSSCSKQEFQEQIGSSSQQETRPTTPEGLNTVALTVANMGVTPDMISGIHKAVVNNTQQGTDEHIAFTDVFSGELRALSSDARNGVVAFASAFQKAFSSTAEKTQLRGLVTIGTEFDLASFLKKENATLYWPYADEWDGKSIPTVVVSTDRDTDERCVGYKLRTENGKCFFSEEVIVDESYALTNPVWVINREAQKLSPKEDQGQLRNLRPVGSKFATLYWGTIQPTKHHDAWHKGGDEYMLQIKAPKHVEVNGKIEVIDYQYVSARETFTRKEIRNRVTRELNTLLVSVWQPELDEVAVHIYENDASLFTGDKTYKVSATWNGKQYGIEFNLPFDSGDDELYSGLWKASIIFSTGNYNLKDKTWVKHYADGLYYTLPFKTNQVIYDPKNPVGFED